MLKTDQASIRGVGSANAERKAKPARASNNVLSWSLVVASNNERLLQNTLLASPAIDAQCQIIVVRKALSAARGYNRGLEKAKADVVVFAHQDVYLPQEWIDNLRRAIGSIEESGATWGVLGVFGVTNEELPSLRGFCYSTGLKSILGAPFSTPVPARTLDELVLVVRRSSGLRFDEQLPGFHLYGADICLQAEAAGLGSYIIPAFCVHNSNGVVRMPSDFWRAYFYLRKRWWKALPVMTCCTNITRIAWPAAHRIAVEWKERVHPRTIGKCHDNIAEFYDRLSTTYPEVAGSPTSVDTGMKFGVLGATLESPNLGVRVLATGAVKCILNAFPGARVFFLDYAHESTAQTVAMGSSEIHIPLVNMRFSKKLWLPNNIAMLILLAIVLRLIPLRRLRSLVLRKNACLREICSTDLFGAVSGGDSFSDIYGIERFFYVTLPEILVLLLGKRLVLLPQTYGPFRRWTGWIARRIVSRSERAWCRDHHSLAELAEEAGFAKDGKLGFCYDIGFAIDSHAPKNIRVEGASIDRTRNARLIGLNISGLLFRRGYTGKNEFKISSSYEELIYAVIDLLLASPETTVLLVPHVYSLGTDLESDTFACEQVFDRLRDKYSGRIAILRGEYGPDEIRFIIGRCDFFIGSRMHACIAALSQCIPAISIAYSDKFMGVMRAAGIEALVADARTCTQEEILAIVRNGMERRVELAQGLHARMPAIRETVVNLLRATWEIPTHSTHRRPRFSQS